MFRAHFFISIGLFGLFAISACNVTHTKIGADYYPSVLMSEKNSLLSVSAKEVTAEESITLELNLRDQNFLPFISALPKVAFYIQGGISSGTIGAIINQGGGRYTASFTGSSSGSATTFHATVDGVEISSSLPQITVVAGKFSKSKSIVTLSAPSILAGSSVIATLVVKDTNGNLLTQGGLAVVFSNSLGTAVGVWGAVNDLGNGTYTANFTATLGGSTTQVTATIEGRALTSAVAGLTINPNPPSVPGSLASVSSLGAVAVSWSPSSGFGSITYSIFRSTTSGSGYVALATGLSTPNYTDSTPVGSTLYYYVVQSQNTGGTSANSIEISARGLVSFSQLWTLNSSFAANFTLGSRVDLTSSTCELTPSSQIDNANIPLGFAGGVGNGVIYGTLADGSSQGLKLGNSGSCDGTSTNCAESNLTTTPQAASVVGMWHLNELFGSASVADSSVSAKPGAVMGGVTLGESGKVGFSPVLDGSSGYIKMGTAGLDGYSEITVSVWVKMNGLPASKYFIAGKEGVYKIDILASGLVRFLTGNNWGGSILYSSAPVSPGAWLHLVATYNGSTKYLYINGVQDSNTVSTAGALNVIGTNDITIGAYGLGGGFGNYLNGQVDEVVFWNKALTSAEVKTLYDNQSSNVVGSGGTFTSRVMDAYQGTQSWTSLSWIPTLPFLKALTENAVSESTGQYSSLVNSSLMTGNVGLWHLDEVSGTSGANSVIDSSGQSSHGTPTSATFGQSGKFNTSVGFNGTGYISNQVNAGLTNQTVTVSAWFRTTSTLQGEIISMGNAYFFRTNYAGAGNVGFRYYNGASYPGISAGVTNATDGSWHQVVGIKSPTEFSIYYDGVHCCPA